MLAQRAVADSPRWTRAVEDQSAPIPKELTSEIGRMEQERPGALLARRTLLNRLRRLLSQSKPMS
jgi:hypothetical protein